MFCHTCLGTDRHYNISSRILYLINVLVDSQQEARVIMVIN